MEENEVKRRSFELIVSVRTNIMALIAASSKRVRQSLKSKVAAPCRLFHTQHAALKYCKKEANDTGPGREGPVLHLSGGILCRSIQFVCPVIVVLPEQRSVHVVSVIDDICERFAHYSDDCYKWNIRQFVNTVFCYFYRYYAENHQFALVAGFVL